ncbi:MAG: relaxase [Sphingomonadales bacterium]|nr:MAG: relaxase [Sphingomonadales bacterium]
MILKGSQRGGARQLGLHLMNIQDNEHVEVHEVRGFMAENVLGALREAEAISMGTRCKQPLFSVSLSPPQHESVRPEVFEAAIAAIEERNGLEGQPRVIVFHEKEGRRHAHAVWSRIDAETMTAKPLPFFKNRLREVSKQLYLENGWQMPRGLMDSQERDPTTFTLAEWQQAKRAGLDARDLKATVQECWAVSDNRQSFGKALEERGLYLAKGDRRSHVAMTYSGEVVAISRVIGRRTKEVRERLGDADDLPGVTETRKRVASQIAPRLKGYIEEARQQSRAEIEPLNAQRQAMQAKHAVERRRMDEGQRQRHEAETRQRAERMRKGLAGLWDRLRGEHARIQKQNEMEAFFALQRDREQRHRLVSAQLHDRQRLQQEIRGARARHAEQLKGLHKDAAHYRLMQRGEAPDAKEHAKAVAGREAHFRQQVGRIDKNALLAAFNDGAAPQSPEQRLEQLRTQSPSTSDKLARLRERKSSPRRVPQKRDRGHEPDLER